MPRGMPWAREKRLAARVHGLMVKHHVATTQTRFVGLGAESRGRRVAFALEVRKLVLQLEFAGQEGVCRVCGCSDAAACETPEGPCHWVERDLCSRCAATGPEGS